MTLSILIEIRLFLILSCLFFLPGSTLLILSNTWTRWSGLQRYIVAIGLSTAFYPILFYMVRFLQPQAALTAPVMSLLLLLAALITGWGWWKYHAFPIRLARLEWVAVVLIGLTFISRFWIAHAHPYPAWSDSLHHTLLTDLTAQYGRLPNTLEPYFPNVLDMYHLGLYAISGTVEMLAQVPAHSALLWTAQFLNSLCGLGIYLALDRHAGRVGAIVGMAIAALFSAHPALWVNWGRFTQLSSQVILPIAWVLTLEVITPDDEDTTRPAHAFWLILFSAMCTAALFLFHFRVAIFYLPLVGGSILFAFWQVRSRSQRLVLLQRLAAIGLATIIIILPVLWQAVHLYLSTRLAPKVLPSPAQAQQTRQNYYTFPLETIPYLAAPIWLLVTAGLAALIGFIRRNQIIITALFWTIALLILGNLYRLNIPVLNVTNLGAILIMFYLPIGIMVGTAVSEIHRLVPSGYKEKVALGTAVFVLIASLPAAYNRATTLEAYRHFITPTDIAAMEWINANIPQDATFAINTYFWLPNFAHGTDAGYWIPYFTGRHIVTSAMLSDGLSPEYRDRVVTMSTASEALETDLSALDDLYNLGVAYIYIGAQGDFSGTGLQRDFLSQSERVELLYENGDTAIFRIKPPA